jgi:hypothetical protein
VELLVEVDRMVVVVYRSPPPTFMYILCHFLGRFEALGRGGRPISEHDHSTPFS